MEDAVLYARLAGDVAFDLERSDLGEREAEGEGIDERFVGRDRAPRQCQAESGDNGFADGNEHALRGLYNKGDGPRSPPAVGNGRVEGSLRRAT